MLNPDTPTAWIVARLRAHAPLVALLSGEHFYQPGEVAGAPKAYVLVMPPSQHDAGIYAERFPQILNSRYTICVETRTDRLADNESLDDVLTPIFLELCNALLGVDVPNAPTGGRVWSCNITGFHTPPTAPLFSNSDVRVQQKGVIAQITSS